MDLTCTENLSTTCTAEADKTIYNDVRVLNNMLNDEVFTTPNCDYFQTVQTDIKPYMRKVVTTWMLEVGTFAIYT